MEDIILLLIWACLLLVGLGLMALFADTFFWDDKNGNND